MDLRYQRLLYFLSVSRQTGTGVGKYEGWHSSSYSRWVRAKARYKNVDRATIRRLAKLYDEARSSRALG